MAHLEVQPKKGSPWLLWLLLAILALAILFFLLRSRDNDTVANEGTDSSMVAAADGTAGDDWWDTVDLNGPAASYDEITDSDIDVRGNNDYAVYSLDETILFNTGETTVRADAAQKLQQVAGSVLKRFGGGEIRVFGHTDAAGNAASNRVLAEERAEAVKTWLVSNGNISGSAISVHPVGEADPAASNATESGRRENRRVEIVVRNNGE